MLVNLFGATLSSSAAAFALRLTVELIRKNIRLEQLTQYWRYVDVSRFCEKWNPPDELS